MEFAVIDANTIVRSNFPTTEHDPKLNNNERLNDLINKLKDVECLDLGCLSKCTTSFAVNVPIFEIMA